MGKLIRLLIGGVGLFMSSAVQAVEWSGYYLATTANSGYITLELIETEESHLVGRYRKVLVGENGPRLQLDFPVSGAVRGAQFVGRIERGWVYGGDSAVSGQRTASGIQLSGSGGLEGHLTTSSQQNERATITILEYRAKQLATAQREIKAKEDFDKRVKAELAEIEKTLEEFKEFQRRWAQTLDALNKVVIDYEGVTARQESMLRGAESLHDDIQRFQVSIDIEQLGISSLFQTNIRVEQSEWESRQALENVQQRLASAMKICEGRGLGRPQESQYLTRCSLLEPVPEQLSDSSIELEATFKNLHRAFQVADERGRRFADAAREPR